ncbi:MAG: hypothetical protein AAFQ81_05575 [Pseudomonadota bacterium]
MMVERAGTASVAEVKPAAVRVRHSAPAPRTRLRHLSLLQRAARHEKLLGTAPVATDTLAYAFALAIEAAPADAAGQLAALRDGTLRTDDLSVTAARQMLSALREARALFTVGVAAEMVDRKDFSVL